MNLQRVLLASAVTTSLGLTNSVTAQEFPIPGRSIRIIVGLAAGGGTDIQARIVQPKLAEALGVPVLVENKPGASTMLAASEVARAAPDGHTILYTFNGTFAQNPHTQINVPYDSFKDFTPISLGARGPQLLTVHIDLPANTVRELIAYGKANPGKLSYASFGAGTSSHIFGEMLSRQGGFEMTHIPYKGTGDAAKDLFAGRVQVMFDAATSAVQHAKNGKMKILGVVSPTRVPLLPNVPTINEQGLKGIDIVGWLAFFGPANMRPQVVEKLHAALVKSLAHPDVKEGFEKGIYDAASSSPAELGAMVKESYDRWGAVIRQMGVKAN
jgi:tripartite-type tricarboxylate transporter receptor subunit TctC